MDSPTTIHQREIPGGPSSAIVHNYSLEEIEVMELNFRAALPPEPFAVGMSVKLAASGPGIHTLALATEDQVFCLSLQQKPSREQKVTLQRLLNIQYLTGFELPYALVLLAHALGFEVFGRDLSTLKNKGIATPGDFLHTKSVHVSARTVNELWDGGFPRGSGQKSNDTPEPDYALRAWFTAIAARMAIQDLPLSQQLSTKFIDTHTLQTFAGLAATAIRRDFLKPRIQENDFSEIVKHRDGKITIQNTRFKTRVRGTRTGQTHLELHLKNGDIADAKVQHSIGKSSNARPERPLKDDITRIRLIGREEITNSETAQYHLLLSSLTDARPASGTSSFVTAIWFPKKAQSIKRHDEGTQSLSDYAQILANLNGSQREIVLAMLSPAPQDSLVIAHGPPGTGKTTTIAAAAAIWESRRVPCWIIAHSNVGVKNIAEKLFEKKVDFRLVVSPDFYFEWHEKLYETIQDKVIRSDDLPKTPQKVLKLFGDATVVLCTLSMLSNPKLEECGLLDILPVKSLVVDEASQIDLFEFMHLFYKFSKVLTKVCFFGDPKQLPPYCAEEMDLETIFDVKHLKKNSYFLDTQYRLPIPLGGFISKNVYEGKLKSEHKIVDHSCIAFIDVWKGEERQQGRSYHNLEEVHMVVKIAGRYQKLGLNFCVITFYDPQRAAIITALENADLRSECVYNVDSFQGNEADYVILSSVRTKMPGFLKARPRMNVALTRCKKGMVVVTSKNFLQKAGDRTLLGRLCRAWSQQRGAACWIDRTAILNNNAALPGLPGLSPPPPPPPSTSQHQSRPTPVHAPTPHTKKKPPPPPPPPPSTSQHQSRPTPVHAPAPHTKKKPPPPPPPPPRGPQASKPQTWMPQTPSLPMLAMPAVPGVSVSAIESWRLGIQSAAIQRQLLDNTFPSMQGLATALDQPSRHRKPKGRKKGN